MLDASASTRSVRVSSREHLGEVKLGERVATENSPVMSQARSRKTVHTETDRSLLSDSQSTTQGKDVETTVT